MYNDTKRTWHDSKSKCESEGYVMAGKPDDAITLRKYTTENFGTDHVWIGAKTDGTVFRWVSSGEAISNTDALWFPNQPTSSKLTKDTCLILRNDYPTQPFYPYSYCYTSNGYTLCE
ncbi:unnamed protein product, partial [Meganyctiphanes norvegica]